MKNYFNDKIVVFGPYVGSFEYEILYFKSFVDWFRLNFKCKKIIVITHPNTEFLYSDNFYDTITILKMFSTDLDNFKNHINSKITAKDYKSMQRNFIDDVAIKYNVLKNDVIVYDIGYTSFISDSYYQRKLLKLCKNSEKSDCILFISDGLEDSDIELFLNENFKNVTEYNIYLTLKVSYDTVYSDLVRLIGKSDTVVCLCGIWTSIANLQGVKVYSWGINTTQCKTLYEFDNKNMIIERNSELKIDKYFLEEMKKFIKE